jgi:dihydroneopterin triphosphate diphosphatase
MRTVQLECIIFRKKDDFFEFLLLKRIPEKGGFWQPISGGLETEDKSKLDGCYREIYEETGIQKDQIIKVISDVHHFVMDKHYLTKKPINPLEEFVFAFEIPEKIIICLDNNIYPEHNEYKWVSFEEAINLLKWDNNKDAFEKLYSMLKKS